MRGLTYQNVSGYSKLAIMAGTPTKWREFLTALSRGHTYNSRDLRTVPTQDLMATLNPMLTDPELMFYLEYEETDLASTILSIAKNYDEAVPRQSSAYIVSSPSANLYVGEEHQGQTKGSYKTSEDNIAYILNKAEEAVNTWVQLGTDGVMQSGVISWTRGAWIPSKVWEKRVARLDEFKQVVKELEQQLKSVDKLVLSVRPDGVRSYRFKNKSIPPEEVSLQKALDNLNQVYNQLLWLGLVSADLDIISLANQEEEHPSLVTDIKNHRFTPDAFYSNNFYVRAVEHVGQVIVNYLDMLNGIIQTDTVAKKHGSVVIRFFPERALISEPLPQIQTTRLSENSFVQTATPAMNLSVSLQGNLAFDTPDTQWRELYAEIFKAIVAKGNPRCTARIGRHTVPNCYLLNMPDLTNLHSTTPTFNFSLISTEWDAEKLIPVNYVG